MRLRMADATRGDYEIFKEMHLNFRYAEIDCDGEMARKPVIKNYEDYFEYVENEWIYFAVTDSDEVVGYVVFTAYEDMSLKIQEIYINKKSQRKGKGKKFVGKIIEMAKDEGFKKIELFSATMATDAFWAHCSFRSVNGSEMFEYQIR